MHSFNFIEQEQGWAVNNDTLDPLLFYRDKLHLIQQGKIKLSESIITATEHTNIGQNIHFNKMYNKKHNQFIKTYKMGVSFKLNHADYPPLFSSAVFRPVSSVSSSLSFTTASRSFSNKVTAISLKSLTKAINEPFPRATRFCPGNFAPKHLHNPSQSLAFDLARKVQTKLKHYVICKAVMSFEPVALNVNLAPVSVCQSVNVVRSVFCHPHISFLAKPLFTTVNLVGPVTVYNVKSVNSPHHIQRVFPSMHCTTSIHRKFSYQRHENVTSFPLPSSNLLPSPVIKSHLSPLTSKLNLSPRPSFLPGTSSPSVQHVSSSVKICLFLMTLFNVILPNQPTQHILVINILTDIILLFLVYLKFCSNMSGALIHYIKQYNNFVKLMFNCFITCIVLSTTCCIEMDNFSATSKAVILVQFT